MIKFSKLLSILQMQNFESEGCNVAEVILKTAKSIEKRCNVELKINLFAASTKTGLVICKEPSLAGDFVLAIVITSTRSLSEVRHPVGIDLELSILSAYSWI